MTDLVLLPGMDGTGSLFASFTQALGHEIKSSIVAYPRNQFLDYEQLETHVREHLPAHDPFILLGESFSGPIAIAIAANPPPNLAALILCCSFAKNPRRPLAILKVLTPLLPEVSSSSMAGLTSLLLLGTHATSNLRLQLDGALARVSQHVLRARLREIIEVDVTDALRRVRIPILYLRATQDRLVPKAACKLIASLAPQTQVADVDGPHMLLQAVPNAAAAIVAKFVK